MNHRYGLLLPAVLVVLLFVGSASAKVPVCPAIPPGPYIPKSPQEDIVKVEAYIVQSPSPAPALPPSSLAGVIGPVVYVTVTFAAATPPADKAIYILVTELQGTTEEVVGCKAWSDPASTTYQVEGYVSNVGASIAVYAWLGSVGGTDRWPNSGTQPITSLSAAAPNLFYDPEPAPVGGIAVPTNKLEILTPYLALVGLVIAVSAVVAVKRRNKD